MRLCIVTHDVVRGLGQGRVNYEIARFALRHRICVRLIADHVDRELTEAGAIWNRAQPRFQRPNLLKVWTFARLANALAVRTANEVDLFHASGFVLKRRHQVNTSHFVHHAWQRSQVHNVRPHRGLYANYQRLYSSLNAHWERRAYEQAGVVVAVSRRVREDLNRAGFPPEKIRVIHNGVDVEEFIPGRADRAALGLVPEVFLALFVGEIRTGRKNLETVLHALCQVPGVHLAVLGDTTGSLYPRMVIEMGLGNRVSFMGYRRDVAEVMRAADVFVFPSRYEGCSLVLLEALASGLPIITAVTAGGAELVTPECGMVLPEPGDAESLAAHLRLLAQDRERRTTMGQAARAVAERHTWTRMAESYLTLYEEVCR